MTMLERLLSGPRARFVDPPVPLSKGARVIAIRNLGECRQDYVCQGTVGTVTAVSRIETYEVAFEGDITLTNLDAGDVRLCA